MDYIHYDLQLTSHEIVEVHLDTQANVRLLDDTNYSRFRRGERHSFYGGRALRSPVRIPAPHAGRWHVVIDLGGLRGQVRTSVNTVSC